MKISAVRFGFTPPHFLTKFSRGYDSVKKHDNNIFSFTKLKRENGAGFTPHHFLTKLFRGYDSVKKHDNNIFSFIKLKRESGAGFTLIEMLLVMAIVAILATLGQMSYSVWLKKVQVNTVVEQIRSSLIRVQQQAVAAEDGLAWGIHFETDRYTIFSSTIYDPADPTNKVKLLSNIVIVNPDSSLSDGNVGFSPNVVFEKFTGRTINIGTITVAVGSDASVARGLLITFFGAIE